MNFELTWEEYLQKIAAHTLAQGGAAFKLDTCQFLPSMDVWSFPKYPGRTRILAHDIDLVAALHDFITENEPFLREPDCWLGTWIHPATQEFYLDVATGYSDLSQARAMALAASQREGRQVVALYNSEQRKTVYL